MSRLASLADGLVSVWAALPALTGDNVDVRRGAPIGGISAGRFVLVEFDGRPDSTADSRFEATWADLAATSIEERGEITCSSVAQTGDSDIAACETQAMAQLNAVRTSLAADRTVGGRVHSASITTGAVTQLQNSQGIAVVIPFTVAYFATYAASAA
jgi:hypothetical protein